MNRTKLIAIVSLTTFIFSSCSILNKRTTHPDGYEPSKITQEILAQISEKKLDKRPQSTFFPQVCSSLLYQGLNNAGKEFSIHTIIVLDTVTADMYHEISVQHLKNGNYSEANEYISKAVAMDPKEHAGYYGWVLLYYYRDYPRAIEYLNLYDDFTPNFSDFPAGENIHYLRGLAYYKMGSLELALSEFDTYIQEEIDADAEDFIDNSVYIHRGRILATNRQYVQAIESFDQALKLNDKTTEAYYYKALTLLNQNLPEDALSNLNKAEELFLQNYVANDIYVELFQAVYLEDILELKRKIE